MAPRARRCGVPSLPAENATTMATPPSSAGGRFGGGAPIMSGLDELRDRYRRSVEAFIQGDPEPQMMLWSRRDDVTIANPYGPPAKGWEGVYQVASRAASLAREGESFTFDRVSGYETADLAYEVGIERSRLKLGGAAEMAPVALRVTTVFRREEDGWRIVHRHADMIAEERWPDPVVPSSG
jgi:ketosteroid isomerase-like protein